MTIQIPAFVLLLEVISKDFDKMNRRQRRVLTYERECSDTLSCGLRVYSLVVD